MGMDFGLPDTVGYYSPEEMREGFKKTIKFQPRVVKQNRGSSGEGIWIIKLKSEEYSVNTERNSPRTTRCSFSPKQTTATWRSTLSRNLLISVAKGGKKAVQSGKLLVAANTMKAVR